MDQLLPITRKSQQYCFQDHCVTADNQYLCAIGPFVSDKSKFMLLLGDQTNSFTCLVRLEMKVKFSSSCLSNGEGG